MSNNNNNVYICLVCKKYVNSDCICCNICDQWLHFRCSNLSKSQFILLSQSNEPYFCYSCLMQVIPSSLVNKKEFNDLYVYNNNNNKKLKYPCQVCNNACKISQNCIQCNLCNVWTHFKCSALTSNQFENHVLNENDTFFVNFVIMPCFPLTK